MNVSKIILFDKRASKEIKKFPIQVIRKVSARIKNLAKHGELFEPFGKKLNKNLFEMRIKFRGQWRVIYAYLTKNNNVIILSAFHKKTQKTPVKELEKAKNRLKGYQV